MRGGPRTVWSGGADDDAGERAWRRHARPDNEVPVSLALDVMIAATDDIAVFICGLAVYRNGVDLTVEVRSRPNRSGDDELLAGDFYGMRSASRLLFGVEYADGRRCANLAVRPDPNADGPQDQPRLRPGGGGGGENVASASWFLCPLPPPGALRIYCAWPSAGIAETVTSIDADRILEAASRVRELWPWEPTTRRPRPLARPVLPAEGWFTQFDTPPE